MENTHFYNPSSTRLTPSKEKEYQELKTDQDLTSILKDILIAPSITRKETVFKINGENVPIEQFARQLIHTVTEYLIDHGYTPKSLKDSPYRLENEIIDTLNEATAWGEKVLDTFFEVVTKNHWQTVTEVMKEIEEIRAWQTL